MEENPLMMVLHGILIGAISYVIKIMLGMEQDKALARSTLFGLSSSAYMIIFGHKLPSLSINPNLS